MLQQNLIGPRPKCILGANPRSVEVNLGNSAGMPITLDGSSNKEPRVGPRNSIAASVLQTSRSLRFFLRGSSVLNSMATKMFVAAFRSCWTRSSPLIQEKESSLKCYVMLLSNIHCSSWCNDEAIPTLCECLCLWMMEHHCVLPATSSIN